MKRPPLHKGNEKATGSDLQLLRPSSRTMNHGDHFDLVLPSDVRNGVRRAGGDQFPGSLHPAFASFHWECCKSIYRFLDLT